MNDLAEMLKTLGINTTVLGGGWLTENEMFLKIVLLLLSIAYTCAKLVQIIKNNEKK